MRWLKGAPLHRRLFMFLGVTILVTTVASVLVALLVHPEERGPMGQWQAAGEFVGERFARVWDNERERHLLAESLADHFSLTVALRDESGQLLDHAGFGDEAPHSSHDDCHHGAPVIDVVRGGVKLGTVELCKKGSHHGWPAFVLFLLTAGIMLWLASGFFARKMGRPLAELTTVARQIGEGNLSRRARLATQAPGEVGELATAVNQMAGRIERQIGEQKELLAAVSHEVRSPLARLRVLSELLRNESKGAPRDRHLEDVEREIETLDSLTGKLLAKSRLDFDVIDRSALDPSDLLRNELRRAGVDEEVLETGAVSTEVRGDRTLLARALGNIIENAKAHGGGVARARVGEADGRVVFEVVDRGPGFNGDADRMFSPFARGNGGPSGGLGLGLALVRQIAEAHGGWVRAEDVEGGGARILILIPFARS